MKNNIQRIFIPSHLKIQNHNFELNIASLIKSINVKLFCSNATSNLTFQKINTFPLNPLLYLYQSQRNRPRKFYIQNSTIFKNFTQQKQI
ncbi:unnamed protein product [Paramecium octaurelia]|uniref:Uncharacterized protein n=1 Tax=Paramecium octaurelia TaxID=43137 RepID=A0A8S1VAZ5_PAROT|nr:unnamed protein product [Paramecium octaurelia]